MKRALRGYSWLEEKKGKILPFYSPFTINEIHISFVLRTNSGSPNPRKIHKIQRIIFKRNEKLLPVRLETLACPSESFVSGFVQNYSSVYIERSG